MKIGVCVRETRMGVDLGDEGICVRNERVCGCIEGVRVTQYSGSEYVCMCWESMCGCVCWGG